MASRVLGRASTLENTLDRLSLADPQSSNLEDQHKRTSVLNKPSQATKVHSLPLLSLLDTPLTLQSTSSSPQSVPPPPTPPLHPTSTANLPSNSLPPRTALPPLQPTLLNPQDCSETRRLLPMGRKDSEDRRMEEGCRASTRVRGRPLLLVEP
jgi:hypothetical protein